MTVNLIVPFVAMLGLILWALGFLMGLCVAFLWLHWMTNSLGAIEGLLDKALAGLAAVAEAKPAPKPASPAKLPAGKGVARCSGN